MYHLRIALVNHSGAKKMPGGLPGTKEVVDLERAMGFEPTISTLGRSHVTATPSPHLSITVVIIPHALPEINHWCPRLDSNQHAQWAQALNLPRIPFRHGGQYHLPWLLTKGTIKYIMLRSICQLFEPEACRAQARWGILVAAGWAASRPASHHLMIFQAPAAICAGTS